MKITKTQLKQIIKEEAVKLQKTSILENRKKEIAKELRQLNEGEDTGNPYDLTQKENWDKFIREIIDVTMKYLGTRPGDAGVSNDNRIAIYDNLMGEISRSIPPSSMNVKDLDSLTGGKESGIGIWTNNKDVMKKFADDNNIHYNKLISRNDLESEESEESGVLNEIKTNPNGFVKALQDVAKDLNLFYNGIQGDIEKQTRIVSQQNGFPEGKDGVIAANKEFEVAIAVPEDKKDLINQASGKLNQKISSFVSMGWDDGGEEKYKKAEGFRGGEAEKYSMPDKSWSLSAFIGPAWK